MTYRTRLFVSKLFVFFMLPVGLPFLVLYAMLIDKNPNIGWLEVILVAFASLGFFKMFFAEITIFDKENDCTDRKIIWFCIIFGLITYLLGEYAILVYCQAKEWEALVATGCWTIYWLLVYTPFVCGTAIEFHEECKRKEQLPMS